MDYGWVIALGFAVVIAIAYGYSKRKKNVTEKSLRESFGEVPNPVYCDSIDVEMIARYGRAKRKHVPDSGAVDDITWRDLDMDDVFVRVNATQSSAGEEVLYELLHDQTQQTQVLENREKLVALFTVDERLRIRVQKTLGKLGKIRGNGVAAFLFDAEAKKISHPLIYLICAVLPVLSALAGIFFAPAFYLLIASVCANVAIHYLTSARLKNEWIGVRYLASFLHCAEVLRKTAELSDWFAPIQVQCARLRPIRRLGNLFTMERGSDLDFLTDYIKFLFLTDINAYNGMVTLIRRHADELRSVYERVGELDCAISIASFRKSVAHCVPQYHDGLSLRTRAVVHPLVRHCVPNDFVWQKNVLISGSNASGKSTFVKAIATNAILAQTIHTALAQEFDMPRAAVATSMAIRDNVQEGESYFVAEIRSLGRIIDKLGSFPVLCFIDEILRGTNTVERIAASASVLYWLGEKNCLCMAATHDIELTEILAQRYENCHFAETVSEQGVTFPFLIREGRATGRNAIRLLSALGYDREITDLAQSMAEAFERERKWDVFSDEVQG